MAKVLLVELETGETIVREPVDAREILATSPEHYRLKADRTPVEPPPKPEGQFLVDKIASVFDDLEEDDFTRGGLPNLDALKRILGFEVSGPERDTAWKNHQLELRDAGETPEPEPEEPQDEDEPDDSQPEE